MWKETRKRRVTDSLDEAQRQVSLQKLEITRNDATVSGNVGERRMELTPP